MATTSSKSRLPLVATTAVLSFLTVSLAFMLVLPTSRHASVPDELAATNNPQLTLYFANIHQDPYERSCGDVLPVQRPISRSQITPDDAVRLLLQGPTNAERAQGFTVEAFQPGPWTSRPLQPLGSYYHHTTVADGVATVDFDPQALGYLNAAICIQGAVKKPIYYTLMQFPGIDEVQFSFDGEVMTEWDA